MSDLADSVGMPVGAHVTRGGVRFRVWAPDHQRVRVVVDGRSKELAAEADGYFSALVADASAGALYGYQLDDDESLRPDPAARFQPRGPHGPSQVVDPCPFEWRHPRRGARREGQIIYEMHVGTFTAEGTFLAAMDKLPALADLGITVIEVMPVNEFAGAFNWGYDGVCLYAPSHTYGGPHDMRAFIDAAHAAGVAVILDVVYNHFGPEGNYLGCFSSSYFASTKTEWGDAINFDGPQSRPVREFFIANAAYWINEFRLDGLRLDATQSLADTSAVHIITEITAAARAAAAETILIVAENEPQQASLLTAPENGGSGIDALWNDDFHHAARVALTGRNEAYMSGYTGSPQEFISLARWGFLYQGQYFAWQKNARGSPALDCSASAFVAYLENHDQVANTGLGRRLRDLCCPAELRAMTALLLLGPATPMLFQGQEFGSTACFVYFAHHDGDLAAATHTGRLEFLAQFPSLTRPSVQAAIGKPHERTTFENCKLRDSERRADNGWRRLHRDLIRMRKTDCAFSAQNAAWIHGAVIGPRAFLLRYRVPGADEKLLVVNLGLSLHFDRCAEPLLAPPAGACWAELWSSEDIRYGGAGTMPSVHDSGALSFQGRSAVVLSARAQP